MDKRYLFNCPLDGVVEAANEVQGGELDCEIHFGICKDCHGYTVFPDDGSRPVVIIRPDQSIMEAMDILAHELAHVICGDVGDDEAHGEKWQSTFDRIFDVYNQRQMAIHGENAECVPDNDIEIPA